MIENIKDRIKKLIDSKQLSSSKFAEIIGVQRATISHVINGRNLPSLDLVRKILISFKTLNSEWLLFGQGPMYKEGSEKELFDEEKPVAKKQEAENETAGEEHLFEEKTKENSEKKSQTEAAPTPAEKIPGDSKSQTDNPSIEKIIILNSDRTFTEYQPK